MSELTIPLFVELKRNDDNYRIDLPVPHLSLINEKWTKLELTCRQKPPTDFWLALHVKNVNHPRCTATRIFSGKDKRLYYDVEIYAGDTAYFEVKPISKIESTITVDLLLKVEKTHPYLG